jgi:hypothetical protein
MRRYALSPRPAKVLLGIQVFGLLAAVLMLFAPVLSLLIMFFLGLFQVVLSFVLLARRRLLTLRLKKLLLLYHTALVAYVIVYPMMLSLAKNGGGSEFNEIAAFTVMIGVALGMFYMMTRITWLCGNEAVEGPSPDLPEDILDA